MKKICGAKLKKQKDFDMVWILIIVYSGFRAGGVGTAEFNTYEACEYASIEANKMDRHIETVCVPKGETE